MNLTEKLRTPHFPHDVYPDHWGPFELHTMVPYDTKLRSVPVSYYQIVINYKPANKVVVVGFDDFSPAWPKDDDDPDSKAMKRREKYRAMAEFRALVKIEKLKHLSAEGKENLRNAGADVSEEACKQGLWIAVYGKYSHLPMYHPNQPKHKELLQVQAVLQKSGRQIERNLFIVSMDPRTAVRSFLYFERIKLLRFMKEVSNDDDLRTDLMDRTIEWFVQKMMEKYPYDDACVPEKRDNYRGARRHTSEARHVFVCHAEWLLEHTTVHKGAEKIISRTILREWVKKAPRMREIAIQEGRPGWGAWDAVWDTFDFTDHYQKERRKYKHYLDLIQKENRQEFTPSSSRSRRTGAQLTRVNKGKGRATTVDEEERAYSWIPDPLYADEEDDGGFSLDEAEWADRVKRPRINLSQDVGPSGTQWTRSSPSLGSGQEDHVLPSPPRGHQPSPPPGTRIPSSSQNPRASRMRGTTSDSFARTPSSSTRNPSATWRFTSPRAPSPGTPPTSRKSMETKNSRISTPVRPAAAVAMEVICISSDDDDIPTLAAEVARSSIAPKSEVIDITDSQSEGNDKPMRGASDWDELENTLPQSHNNGEPPYSRQRTSILRETVIDETPPRARSTPSRPESPAIEEIPESQDEAEDFNSSDSESKYAQRPPGPPSPNRERIQRLVELNRQINEFAPMAIYDAYAPQTWKPWMCNFPNQNLKPGCDPKLAQRITCTFEINLRRPSLEVQRLLNQRPRDAEFLKHLLTEPCIFTGPRDELPVAIFNRVVELHFQEHFKYWGVVKKIVSSNGQRTAHFEPLDD
ncbi:unnamed protein product [Rhizoctonia solani]|uniref:Uncharacterized protein n=1 Tax=Rhizoctonia solani TaxID=456999 RepID=A0A8H3A0G0_9AGAM|nr:unnamed protein product [Rhizoctonia solani]